MRSDKPRRRTLKWLSAAVCLLLAVSYFASPWRCLCCNFYWRAGSCHFRVYNRRIEFERKLWGWDKKAAFECYFRPIDFSNLEPADYFSTPRYDDDRATVWPSLESGSDDDIRAILKDGQQPNFVAPLVSKRYLTIDGERVAWCVYHRAYSLLIVPIWLPFLITLLPTIRLFYLDRRHPTGHCETCGYNLHANTSGRCPECGLAIMAT